MTIAISFDRERPRHRTGARYARACAARHVRERSGSKLRAGLRHLDHELADVLTREQLEERLRRVLCRGRESLRTPASLTVNLRSPRSPRARQRETACYLQAFDDRFCAPNPRGEQCMHGTRLVSVFAAPPGIVCAHAPRCASLPSLTH